MKKIITLLALFTIILNGQAQEKKSKTYQQHRSAESGKYVTKKEAKANPSTTYSTKRKR